MPAEEKNPLVLVVDDNPSITRAVALALRLLGFRVDTLSAPEAALPFIVERKPEFALIDLWMPGMDGWDLARRVRERDPEHATKLIAITGFCDPDIRARSLESGFDEHLLKPLSVDDLKRVLG